MNKTENNKYQNGKIYCIRSHNTEAYYIGSTCSQLSKRFHQHKSNYWRHLNGTGPKVYSFQLFNDGIENCYIELIENYPCSCKDELVRREGEIIRQHRKTNQILNVATPNRTKQEYHKDNRVKILDRVKKWVESNKEKRTEYTKEYHQKNKAEICEKTRLWREQNPEKNKEYNEKKVLCECGKVIGYKHYSRHKKTEKHINDVKKIKSK
jgi:hypothetical protein